jgi:CRISPR/Cas system-associated exonuclease Cas4 (RecB family)
MRTIRASEIGSFLFCARAWWYQRQGMPSENQAMMEAGSRHHQAHGGRVAAAGLLQKAGWVLLGGALLLLAAGVVMALLS